MIFDVVYVDKGIRGLELLFEKFGFCMFCLRLDKWYRNEVFVGILLLEWFI